MQPYEFLILSAGHPITIIEEAHISDHAAIRSARKFAADRPFQVWKGLDCIYETPTALPSSSFAMRA